MSTVNLEDFRRRIEEIKARFPRGHTAILPSLLAAQETFGYVTPESLALISEVLGIPQGILVQTGSYYHFIDFEFKGRHRLYLCTNLSCLLNGAMDLVEHLKKRLGVEEGEVTEDGLFSFEQVECIGLCDGAPAGILDGEQHTFLSPEVLDRFLESRRETS